MKENLKWKMIAIATAWVVAGIVGLIEENALTLMMALLATAMIFTMQAKEVPKWKQEARDGKAPF